jgi:hypothetical protein
VAIWVLRQHIVAGGDDADDYCQRPDLFHRLTSPLYDPVIGKALATMQSSTLSAAAAYNTACSSAERDLFVECYVQKQLLGVVRTPDAPPPLTASAVRRCASSDLSLMRRRH